MKSDEQWKRGCQTYSERLQMFTMLAKMNSEEGKFFKQFFFNSIYPIDLKYPQFCFHLNNLIRRSSKSRIFGGNFLKGQSDFYEKF